MALAFRWYKLIGFVCMYLCIYIYLFTGIFPYLYRCLREHLHFFRDSAVMSLQVGHSLPTCGRVCGEQGTRQMQRMSLIHQQEACLSPQVPLPQRTWMGEHQAGDAGTRRASRDLGQEKHGLCAGK